MYFINESTFITLFLLSLTPMFHNAKKLEVRYCGFEQTCARNNHKHILNTDACCRPCECDDICKEKGTCCRDRNRFNVDDNDIKQKCLASAYVPNGISLPYRIISYFNRIICPKSFNDTNIKVKCEEDRLETLADIRPVSSHNGKVIYKNKYCSYCHGEQRVNSWNAVVHMASPQNCRTVLQEETLNIDTITSKILSNCVLVFKPPKNIVFWDVLCFNESAVIKQCNKTGNWNFFDFELSNLCLNEKDTGYYIYESHVNIYNNLYCALCNDFTYDSVDACVNTIERFPNKPLFTLMNVNKLLDQDNPKRNTRRCANGEIFDTFFNVCRTLYCFLNSISFQGNCVPFIEYPNKMGYQIVVKIVPTEIMKQSDLTQEDLKNNYISVLEQLGFVDCELCYLYIFAERGSPKDFLQEIYIQSVYTPTSRCKIEYIWSKFMAAEKKLPFPLNLTVNKTKVVFNAFWEGTASVKSRRWNILLQVGSPHRCHTYSPTRGQICPKVKLLKHEIEAVMKYHPLSEELVWVKDQGNINGSAFVCCHKYITHTHSFSSMKCHSSSLIYFIIIIFGVWNIVDGEDSF